MHSDKGLAAEALREARRRAGLTQVELARLAGVTQSVISAYESGKRQPTLPSLAALVRAAGLNLEIALHQAPEQQKALDGPIGRLVQKRRHELLSAASSYGVSNLRVFGSVARGVEGPDSDVDLLADLPPTLGLFGLGRLQADLEGILGRRVDLIPARDLKPDVRARVEGEAITL